MDSKKLKELCFRAAGSFRDFAAPIFGRFLAPAIYEWSKRGFASPPPPSVKRAVLDRYSNSDCAWIETGTFRGDTTAFLSTIGRSVHSIEPQPELAAKARERFSHSPNVTVIEGLSELSLDGVLSELSGPVRLWLDGHFSGGVTHKGPQDTPIREELLIVERHLPQFPDIAVMIDDMRMFDPNWSDAVDYPTRSELVHWADRLNLWWTIEQDIFIASTRPLLGDC